MEIFTVAQMQQYEQDLFKGGLNADILMENAGRLCAQQLLNSDLPEGQVTVLCGPGGNGGDGLVLARCLMENKVPAVCYIVPSQNYKELVLKNIKRAFVCHVSVKEIEDISAVEKAVQKSALVVDALLGLGASATHSGSKIYQALADIINHHKNIVSIDGPTGLDLDNADHYLERPVKAMETYTLGFIKRGLILPAAAEYIGKLTVLDIFAEILGNRK